MRVPLAWTQTSSPSSSSNTRIASTLGAMVVLVPAILLGTRSLRNLPTTALRLGASVALVIFGAVQGLGALRLI